MSKRVKVLVSVVVAILLLTVGFAIPVMAQEEPTAIILPVMAEEEPTLALQAEAKGLLARVAEILDIPEEDLVNAFKQARQEMMEERWQEAFYRWLDKAVAVGLLTQEEADEIKEWWEQKPEALGSLLQRAFDFGYGHMPGNRWGQRLELMPQSWQEMKPYPWQQMKPPW
ncbi:MAG: hypothetical protein QMC90_00800 [Dehalococcoidales bacterium]|nr:hypothetical protein [Dehalococcoidales bacterium]